MPISKQRSLHSLANTQSNLARRLGRDHPDVIAAKRDLEAAHFTRSLSRARAEGLSNDDLVSLVRTGRLPAEVAVAS